MTIIPQIKINKEEFIVNKNGKKNFRGWMKVKEMLHYRDRRCAIKDGEIWWSSVGENVGTEICGKGMECVRPVLILKKITKTSFWAVPLTSKKHSGGSWYVPFEFDGRYQEAVVIQVEYMSTARLHRKMGELSTGDYRKVVMGFRALVDDIKIRPSLTTRGCAGNSRKCTLRYNHIVS